MMADPKSRSGPFLVLPALVCNYLGQGALILNDPRAVENPFDLLPCRVGPVFVVLLSTAATVIASQAVITGAYSLASQAIQLVLLPRLEIVHTSSTQEGQIFIPRVTLISCSEFWGSCLSFRSSDSLVNAYGIAVCGTMVATTSLAFFVVWKLWRWPLWEALVLTGAFLSIDVAFFIANLYKVVDGGWVPLTLGAAMFILMWNHLVARQRHLAGSHVPRLDPDAQPDQDARKVEAGEGSGNIRVFLTNDPTSAPSSLMHNLKHNKVVHERVVLLNVSDLRPERPCPYLGPQNAGRGQKTPLDALAPYHPPPPCPDARNLRSYGLRDGAFAAPTSAAQALRRPARVLAP